MEVENMIDFLQEEKLFCDAVTENPAESRRREARISLVEREVLQAQRLGKEREELLKSLDGIGEKAKRVLELPREKVYAESRQLCRMIGRVRERFWRTK